MRQSAVEARNRSKQAVATSVILGLLIVTLAFISSNLLGGLKKTDYSFGGALKQEKRKKKKDEKKEPSFFLSTTLITSNIKLGAYVVSTNVAPLFKKESKLDVDFQPFMVGKLIGVINESQKVVVIQVFPTKPKFLFNSQLTYLTPFVYLDELEGSTLFKSYLLLYDAFQSIQ